MKSIGTTTGGNYWALGASEHLPHGVVLSVSVVLNDSAYAESPVVLSSISVHEGALSVTVSASGGIVGYGSTDKENSVIFLTTKNNCLSAQIEVGTFKGLELNSIDPITINPIYVLKVSNRKKPKTFIVINQDGVQDVVSINENYELVLDPRLSLSINEKDKKATVSLSEENFRGLLSVFTEAESTTDRLLTINGKTPDEEGVLDLSISNNEEPLGFSVSGTVPMITIESELSMCEEEDIIDSYMSPDNVRNFTYMPLDDAYILDKTTKKHKRDTEEKLNKYNKLDTNFDSI